MKKIFEVLKKFGKRFKEPHNEVDFIFLSTLALYALLIENVVDVNRSEGESMLPTIQDYSILVIDKFFFQIKGLKRGDVVVARSTVDPYTLICKRVCGLEGDSAGPFTKVPRGHFWAEGDNKEFSFDSRHHGPIPLAAVQGKVLFSLCPWKFSLDRPTN